MTITFPLQLPRPSADIAEMTLTERSLTLRSVSPFTFEEQAYSMPAQRWECTIELNPLTRAAAEPWLAWLLALRGGYGTFAMGDLNATVPRGSGGGSPIVSVDSLNSSTVQVYGATSSVSNWLMAGDYIQIGLNMYKNLQDVNTIQDGITALDIWPSLRSVPSSGATIIVNSPVALWRLQDDTVSRRIEAPGVYHIAFSAVEKLP